ncbi:unnamed protein product [Closterium sp. Naga37s-1]|nr:unnamed protein product [Closterium sp. Naga37s-1]
MSPCLSASPPTSQPALPISPHLSPTLSLPNYPHPSPMSPRVPPSSPNFSHLPLLPPISPHLYLNLPPSLLSLPSPPRTTPVFSPNPPRLFWSLAFSSHSPISSISPPTLPHLSLHLPHLLPPPPNFFRLPSSLPISTHISLSLPPSPSPRLPLPLPTSPHLSHHLRPSYPRPNRRRPPLNQDLHRTYPQAPAHGHTREPRGSQARARGLLLPGLARGGTVSSSHTFPSLTAGHEVHDHGMNYVAACLLLVTHSSPSIPTPLPSLPHFSTHSPSSPLPLPTRA